MKYYLKAFKIQRTGLFLSLFLVFVGLAFLRLNVYFGYVLCTIPGLFLFVYYLFQLIIYPNKVIKKAERIKNTMGLESEWGILSRFFKQDLTVFRILFKNPVFIIIYGLTMMVLCPLSMLYLFKGQNYILEYLNLSSQSLLMNIIYIGLPIYFVLCFSVFNSAIIAYLTIGEIVQSRIQTKMFSLFELLKDYIYAFPFVLFLSVFGIILLFSSKESKNKAGDKSLIAFLGIEWTISFIYVNLALIALENKTLSHSLKESLSFYKENVKNLFYISLYGGMLFILLMFLPILIYIWTDIEFLLPLSLIIGLIGLSVKLMSEQLSVFYYMIKIRHPEVNVDNLFRIPERTSTK